MTPVERERHVAERAAQGLPPHLEDPLVAARVAALLLPTPIPHRKKAAASVSAAAAQLPEVCDATARPTP